ncbi:MAG: hypothetical protein JXL82_04095 [Candidatus Omnitrophica bacterium]|nr:hypothetical protein [Candidatus Omnitrophota bacterium]
MPAFMSFLIPGLGQIIKGQVGKGILIFVVILTGYFLMIIPGIIMHIIAICDAYNCQIKGS